MSTTAFEPTTTTSSDAPSMELTILMPCLNEAETVETCVKKAISFLRSRNVNGEVLIADNGSTDGSQELAIAAGARVANIKERGYGAALIGGIEAAQGRYVIMGDADDSYDFSSLDAFVKELRSGTQVVMGNRFRGGIEPGAMPFLNRYLGNPVLSFLGRTFFRSDIRDFHCGLRGFDRASIQELRLTTKGMEFASEMVVKASLAGLSIAEVPTTLSKDGRNRPPHLRPWRDGWRHLRFLLLFAPHKLFFLPGCLLGGLGLLGSLLLLTGQIQFGGVTLDTSSLLFSASMVVIGVQLLLFYSTAQAIADSLFGNVKRGRPHHKLEPRLIVGVLIFLLGLILAISATVYWGARDFHGLDPSRVLRMTIPAATLMVIALQIIFTAFLHSMLLITGKLDEPAGTGIVTR